MTVTEPRAVFFIYFLFLFKSCHVQILVNWFSAVQSQYRTRWNLSLVRMQGTKVFLMFTGEECMCM